MRYVLLTGIRLQLHYHHLYALFLWENSTLITQIISAALIETVLAIRVLCVCLQTCFICKGRVPNDEMVLPRCLGI